MQALDQLSREELLALVYDLQSRIGAQGDGAQAAATDLDYVTRQALTVLDNSGIAALVFDTVGQLTILAANACLSNLVGRTRDALERLSVTELLVAEDHERLRRVLRLPRQGGFGSAGGWRLLTRSREVREIEVGGYDLDFRGHRARFVIVQDVTGRQREQLVQQRLAAIVETSRDTILSHTVDGIVLSWNRAAGRLFGYGAAEIVGRSVDTLLPHDIREREREFLRGRIAAGLPIDNYHTSRQHKDGSRLDVTLSAAPLRDAEGHIIGAASIIRDVRQQKMQERLVVESYQRLKFALESAALSLWDWDIPAGTMIYSDEFARTLGFAPGELPRDSHLCEHLVHGEDAPVLREAMAAHLRGTVATFECEFRVRRRDDRWCWLSARGQLLARDHAGNPLRMTGTAQDVTQPHRGRAIDRMLAAVLDSSDHLIVSRSLDGTVLTWNRGAERSLGWHADEIVGSSYLLCVPESHRTEAERITAVARAGHRISHLETVYRHKLGHNVYLSLTASPLRDTQARVVGVAIVGRDITGQRDGQRSLQESEARFRSLVEASAHAVWITNAAGEVDGEIPSWQAYTGLSFEQVRGLGWLLAVHPEDRAVTAQKWALACRSGNVYDGEFRVRRRDGAWRHMHAHAVPVRNADGTVREWVGMNTDVTERKEAEAARSLLAAVADSSQDAIISHDIEGTILSWNHGAEEIFGYRADEVIGRNYRLLTPSTTPERTSALAQRLLNGERIAPFEVSTRHRDGHEIPVSVSLAALRDEAGRVVGVTTVARDITEPRRAAQALRENEQQLQSILDNAAEAVIVVDADGSIERFNLAAQRLFGYNAEEAHDLNLRNLTVELALDDARSAGDERPAAWIGPLMGGRREITGRRKDGSIFPLELSLSEIGLAPRPPRFTAVVRDITDRKSWENRIYTLAYTDSLTGLPNRLLLRDRLEHAIAAAQRNRTQVGVLFFDLDHFKAINDSYGHHMGDALLRKVAERTAGCVREIDTVCRLGGDEFVLVLPELHGAADAGAVARKLLAALSQPYRIDGHELHITPTLGISIYPQDGSDADTLMRNADTAMYHAKESGKNAFRFYGNRSEA